jgi:Tfp pilus assembly protein PilW
MKVRSRPSLPRRVRFAFTITELMVALGLGSIVLATVASLSIYASRTCAAIVNYTDLDTKSRYALDIITREIRSATAVTAIQNSLPIKFLVLTNAVDGTRTRLIYDSTSRILLVQRSGQADLTALTECDRWNCSLYQRTPLVTSTNILYYPATNTAGNLDLTVTKLVSLSWKCSRTIMAQKLNTESVQAAQVVLRNKQ